MLLYVHVPFCRSKCRYCAFHSVKDDPLERGHYLRLLRREIAHWGEALGRPGIETLYLGGGTPSLLDLPQLEAVLSDIFHSFSPAPALELTLEANPDSALREGYLRGLRSLGVSRLSLGVQSLRDEDLALLGRPHTADEALRAYETARQAGFDNISLDFIWGLPGQRAEDWLGELHTVARLSPEHISAYGLTLEPGTPLERMCSAAAPVFHPLPPLPTDEEQAAMFLRGSEYLESQGYTHYEISNFARPGFISRHNSGYWEGRDYLGLGPAAVSTVGGKRWENPHSLDDYAAVVDKGGAARGIEDIDPATRAEEMVMLALRTARGLSLPRYAEATGHDFLAGRADTLGALVREGLAVVDRERVRLTRSGMLVSSAIIARLLEDE